MDKSRTLAHHWTTDTDNNGDSRYDHSIELSWEELRYVIEGKGFQLQSQQQQKGSGFKELNSQRRRQSAVYQVQLFPSSQSVMDAVQCAVLYRHKPMNDYCKHSHHLDLPIYQR